MSKFENKTTGLLTNVDLKGTKGKIIYWFFFAVLIVCCIITLFPAVWTVFTSLKDPKEIYTSTKFFPEHLSWNIFVTRVCDSWNQLKFGRSILNTFYYSIVQWVIKLTVCMFAGYTFSKLKPKGSTMVFALILWTMMMPGQMRMVPNYISYMSFPFASKTEFGIGINLLDTYWPLWLGGAVDAFAIMLFKNAFDGISNSIIEAATIDGAGKLRIFFIIMVPLCVPIIIYESIMTLSGAWSNFFGPYLIIQTTTKQLLPAKIFLMGNDGTVKQNTYLMGLIIGSIPQLLIFAFFKKYIMGGINVGGVKG
ncbi:MAG: carbohydrate ABC transporter permease [Clostridia bacterium]|nr:carbohydrate ABC transporter permease [Clostridia bacterium]